MPMLGAILTPHPPVLLPEVGKGREREIAATGRAMAEAAAEVARWAPDVLIVASPHTILYGDYFHISPGRGAAGSMSTFGAPQVRIEARYDVPLRDEIVRTVRESVDALKEGREIVQRTRLGGETLGQTAHDMGIAYRQAAALRRRAEKALRRDRRLRALVDEQTRFHAHKGVKAFLSDHTSVVEAAVIWREDHR